MTVISPQDAVERALNAATCDDCVVIAEENSSANLRWARNSLTTNGISASRRLTVIAIIRDEGQARAGAVSRAGASREQIPDLVAEAEKAAAEGSPAEDAQPLVAPAAPGPSGTTRRAAPRSACCAVSPGPSVTRSPSRPRAAGACTGSPSTH